MPAMRRLQTPTFPPDIDMHSVRNSDLETNACMSVVLYADCIRRSRAVRNAVVCLVCWRIESTVHCQEYDLEFVNFV